MNDDEVRYDVEVMYEPADQMGVPRGSCITDAVLKNDRYIGTLASMMGSYEVSVKAKLCKILLTIKPTPEEVTPIDEFHYHEAIDRLHVVMCMIDDHILSHPVCVKHDAVAALITAGQDSLAEAYQALGKLDMETDEEN